MVMGNEGAIEMLEKLPEVEGFLIISTKLGTLKVEKTSGWSAYEPD